MTFRCLNGQYYTERIPLSQYFEYRAQNQQKILVVKRWTFLKLNLYVLIYIYIDIVQFPLVARSVCMVCWFRHTALSRWTTFTSPPWELLLQVALTYISITTEWWGRAVHIYIRGPATQTPRHRCQSSWAELSWTERGAINFRKNSWTLLLWWGDSPTHCSRTEEREIERSHWMSEKGGPEST